MRVPPRFFALIKVFYEKKKKKISMTCRSYVAASTMNVSILALTLLAFTPECPSGYIRRWPTYTEVHS